MFDFFFLSYYLTFFFLNINYCQKYNVFMDFCIVNAMTQVNKAQQSSSDDDDERELSPEESLPLYQQRENFYS